MQRNRVLLIEDDDNDAQLIQTLLKDSDNGFECMHVPCLNDGMELLDEADIVLLDLSLPDAMGFNMLKDLRVRAPELPVILMTGFEDTALSVKTLREGAQDYLAKNNLRHSPEHAASLTRAILHASARKRSEAELQASYHFLDIVNRHSVMQQLLPEFVTEIREFSSCCAVAIRLFEKDQQQLPLTCATGFVSELDAECSCSAEAKNMCFRVLGGLQSNGLKTVSPNGSFYNGHISNFLASLTEKEKVCGFCGQYGYETLALVPIRHSGRILGLIHLADKRQNVLPVEMIAMLEHFGEHLGTAITRIKAETRLQQREAELSATFERAPFAMIVLDSDGRILDINQAGAEFVGKTVAEIVGLDAGQAMGCAYAASGGACKTKPECSDCPIRQAVLHTLENKKNSFQNEISLPFMRGTKSRQLHLVVSTTYISADGGKVILYVEDASKRFRLEQNLRLFRHLLLKAGKSLLIIDVDQERVTELNQAFCELVGYTRAELLLMNLGDILVPQKKDQRLAKLRDLKAGDRFSGILSLMRKDGSVCKCQTKCTRVKHSDSGLEYWVFDLESTMQNQLR